MHSVCSSGAMEFSVGIMHLIGLIQPRRYYLDLGTFLNVKDLVLALHSTEVIFYTLTLILYFFIPDCLTAHEALPPC